MRRSVLLEELLGSVHIEMLSANAYGPPCCQIHLQLPFPLQRSLADCPSILHLRSIPGVDEAVNGEVVVVVVLGSLAAAAGMEGAVVCRGRSRNPLQLVW